ncbi:MAG: hypothetical protein M5U12_31045 [Verrucomicrobia bacterium]|nr:hypothetical protein [Verrucomicrobiota bacterium]
MQASLSLPTLLLETTLALGLLGQAHADRVLFDFAPPFSAATVATHDAQASLVDTAEGRALRVATGHAAPWPGITLSAPGGTVDLTEHAFVQLRVRNPGPQRVVVHLRVDNAGADGTRHCRTGSLGLDPGTSGTVRVDLTRTSEDRLNGRLFGMRGYPVKAGGPDTVDPAAINQFVIFLNAPRQDHVFEVLRLSAGGRYTAPTAWTSDADPYLPLIDPLGQYRHKTWPGKTPSVEDLVVRRDQEAVTLPAAISAFDDQAGWNRFGGWAGDRNSPPPASSASRSTTGNGGSWTRRAACSGPMASTACGCWTRRRSRNARIGTSPPRGNRLSSRSSSSLRPPRSKAITPGERRRASPSPAPTSDASMGPTGAHSRRC